MKFEDYQLVTLVRHIESRADEVTVNDSVSKNLADNVATVESELRNQQQPFGQLVKARARQLAQLSGAGTNYWRFVANTKTAILTVTAVMAVVGFIAAFQALDQGDSQINIYWLLLLLLGFNLLSILLWLIFTVRASLGNRRGASSSPTIATLQSLLRWFSKRHNNGLNFATWNETNLFGRIGQWFTSKVIHGSWLAYLVGGLLALLLALSGKQYDFVWGTTILSEQSFVNATNTLAALPAALGFEVPSTEQILASKKGTATESAELRSIWAQFLIACILLYGILPRIILWLLSAFKLRQARLGFKPDWGQPYFFNLRSRLLPEHVTLGVVDADESSGSRKPGLAADQFRLQAHDIAQLPENSLLAGFEWGEDPLPDIGLKSATMFGAVDEKAEQQAAIERMQTSSSALVLLVPLERVVDRGASRLLKKLAAAGELHLAAVQRQSAPSDAARWAAWNMTAEGIDLPATQVHLISLIGKE